MPAPTLIRLAKTPVPSTEAVAYQVPTGYTVSVTQIVLCNTSASAVTVNVAITASASSSTVASDRIFSAMSVAAGETMMAMANIILLEGEKLWANASANNVVNLVASGVLTQN